MKKILTLDYKFSSYWRRRGLISKLKIQLLFGQLHIGNFYFNILGVLITVMRNVSNIY